VIPGSDLRRYRRLHLKPGEINGNTPVQTLKNSNCPRRNITKSTVAKADSILQVSGFKFERHKPGGVNYAARASLFVNMGEHVAKEHVAEGNLCDVPDDLTVPQFILDSAHPMRPIRKEGIPWLVHQEKPPALARDKPG